MTEVIDIFMENVKNSIRLNLRLFAKHGEKKELLEKVIDYCKKLLDQEVK